MKKMSLIAMGVALIMTTAVYATGRTCTGVDGKPCHSGTQHCRCKHHNMPGQNCTDVSGNTCHSGTQGCMCKH